MTREEAIQLIDEIASSYYPCDKKDALEMSILALEQQPCKDAISRDDALKALDYDIKSFEFKSGVDRHMNEIANLLNTIYEIQSDNIKALPPVQPKPIECEDAISRKNIEKLKRWRFSYDTNTTIPKSDLFVKLADIRALPLVQPKPKTGHWTTKPHVYGVTYCSECDFELKIDNTNYCPNCGCRMVKPQESEET